MVVLVDKMLKTQIASCSAVANWLFSSQMSRDFTRLVSLSVSSILTVHLLSYFHQVGPVSLSVLNVNVHSNPRVFIRSVQFRFPFHINVHLLSHFHQGIPLSVLNLLTAAITYLLLKVFLLYIHQARPVPLSV